MSGAVKNSKILRGVVPPMCTPFNKEYGIDEKSLRRLINHLLDNGVHGIFALGSTSEVSYLTDKNRAEILRITVDEVAGRVPVVAGVIDMTSLRVIEHVKTGVKAGVDGFVLTAPFYARINQAEIIHHFRLVKEACGDLPLYAYDIPALINGVKLDTHTVLSMAKEGIIAGLKDSSGIDSAMRAVMIGRKDYGVEDFVVLTGSELTVDTALIAGADGVVPGIGNIDPAGFVKIYDYVKAGNISAARAEQERIFTMFSLLNVGSLQRLGINSAHYGAFKASLKMLGIIDDARTALPSLPLLDSEVEALRPHLVKAGLLKN